jgi:hypothetical protein
MQIWRTFLTSLTRRTHGNTLGGVGCISLLACLGCFPIVDLEDGGSPNRTCVADEECRSNERCLDNICEVIPLICSSDRDCRQDQVCENGSCIEPCTDPALCPEDSSDDGGAQIITDAGLPPSEDSGSITDSGPETDASGLHTADGGSASIEDSGSGQEDSGTVAISDAGPSPTSDAGPASPDAGGPPDAGSIMDAGNGSGLVDAGTGEPFSSKVCELPVTYERIGHTAGSADFYRVSWAPSGAYALVIGYPAKLYRYDPADESLVLIGEASNERWNVVRFSKDDSYALIGGNESGSSSQPVLYLYLQDGTFQELNTGGLFSGSRVQDIQPRPGTDSYGVLSDNGYDTSLSSTSIAYVHELSLSSTEDVDGGITEVTTNYFGGVGGVSQGASSLAWGENLGSQIALGVSRYLELIYLNPALSSNQVSLQSHGNVGNLKKVIFHPDLEEAWILQWSGQGKVYAWEGALHTDDSFGFSGWSMWDFSTTEDGHWKIFIGRNGNIWFSDSPFRPVTANRFYNHPIPGFGDSPWSGGSNTYLHEAAFRPSSCDGLIVGDATQSQGLLIRFSLVQN